MQARSGLGRQGSYAAGGGCTTRRENAHGTDFREVLYRYHPWFGREVGVHDAVAKSDGIYLRCAVAGGHGDRWLEVAAWMFERTSCPGDLRLTATPFVSLGALAELSALLDGALKTSMASSNAELSICRRGQMCRGPDMCNGSASTRHLAPEFHTAMEISDWRGLAVAIRPRAIIVAEDLPGGLPRSARIELTTRLLPSAGNLTSFRKVIRPRRA